ncbi:MAG: MATE family efflux transporter [Dorea sp.]|jgi:putative MATE family efflux protein|nr:MATE family efflux transporter [Dorea sp.]
MSQPQIKFNTEISKTILMIAWPAMLEQLLACMASLVDTAMVGSLGAVATASVAVNISLVWVTNGLMGALSIGFSYMIARSVGEKNPEKTRNLGLQSITCAICTGLFLFVLIFCLHQWLPVWMGAKEDVIPYAREYLRIIGYGMVPQTLAVVLSSNYRSTGNTRLPLILGIISNIANIIGNFFLIYPERMIFLGGMNIHMWGAGMGIKGAALATSASQVFLTVMLLLTMCRQGSPFRLTLSKREYAVSKNVLLTLKKISIPVLFERWTLNFGQVFITSILSALGTVSLSAHYLTAQIEGILYMPAFGVSYTATALIGQALGAGRKDLAKQYMKYICFWSVVLIELLCIPVACGSHYIMQLFSSDPDVVVIGTKTLLIAALTEIFYSFFLVSSGIFRGAGDVRFSFLVSLIGMWGLRVGMIWMAVRVFDVGIVGVWIIIGIDCMVRMILCIVRLRSGKWLKIGINF